MMLKTIIPGSEIKRHTFTISENMMDWLKGKYFSYLQIHERNISKGVVFSVYYIEERKKTELKKEAKAKTTF